MRDGALEQQHREIRRVRSHPRVDLRRDLVTRGRQPHDTFAMRAAVLVHVAPREHERELGAKRGIGRGHHAQTETRWMNSQTIVTVSMSTSDAPAFNAPISILDGHASVKW